jgi:hypothetical protein
MRSRDRDALMFGMFVEFSIENKRLVDVSDFLISKAALTCIYVLRNLRRQNSTDRCENHRGSES